MTCTTATLIRGSSLGDPDRIATWAKAKGCERPDDVADYLDTLYRLCRSVGLNAAVLVAQSIHETSESGVPWASYWWQQRLNPAGIGITGDPAQNAASRTFTDGAAAARAHALHMYLYTVGTDIPTGLSKQDDPRWQAAVNAGRAGIARTIDDLTGKWGTDPKYATGVVKWLNALDDAGLLTAPTTTPAPEPTGDTTVSTYTTVIPGLPGGPLTTDYPINTSNMLGYSEKQRPGIKAKYPRRSVQHGTGNPNSMAASENRWLVQGAADGQWVSFHYVTDDTGAYVNLPVDEISYQAADGAGPGNMNGLSCEQIENEAMWADSARALRCIYITADLMGRSAARLDIAIPEQHWTFNYALPASQRHDCPNKLRYKRINGVLAWDIYVKQWNTSKADELKRMANGGVTAPTEPASPAYAKPNIPDWMTAWTGQPVMIGVPGVKEGTPVYATTVRYVADKTTPRLQFASDGSAKVGPDLVKGEEFPVAFIFTAANGKQYGLTMYGTRVLLDDLKVASAALGKAA